MSVQLRSRKLKSGEKSLYLDIHHNGERWREFLKIRKVMPTEDIRFSNPNKEDTLRKQVLDGEELQNLANTRCGNPEVKKAFLFACYTSLGLAEIRELT